MRSHWSRNPVRDRRLTTCESVGPSKLFGNERAEQKEKQKENSGKTAPGARNVLEGSRTEVFRKGMRSRENRTKKEYPTGMGYSTSYRKES